MPEKPRRNKSSNARSITQVIRKTRTLPGAIARLRALPAGANVMVREACVAGWIVHLGHVARDALTAGADRARFPGCRGRRLVRGGDRGLCGGGWGARSMTIQTLGVVAGAVGLERGMGIVAGRARKPVRVGNEAAALGKRGALEARELGVAGLGRAVLGVALHARGELCPRGSSRREVNRHLGKARSGGQGVIQARPMAALATDSAVLCFGGSWTRSIRVDCAKPGCMARNAVVYRLRAERDTDVVSWSLGCVCDAFGLPPGSIEPVVRDSKPRSMPS